jgi:hypothetical protein
LRNIRDDRSGSQNRRFITTIILFLWSRDYRSVWSSKKRKLRRRRRFPIAMEGRQVNVIIDKDTFGTGFD